jgi:integrase/recombinase XerD
VVRVQKIRVPDTGHLSWIVIDGEHLPVGVVNEYLVYLYRLGRSPNTVRAYAHHLQAYWAFLVEQKHDWRELKLTQFASWVRHAARSGGSHRFHPKPVLIVVERPNSSQDQIDSCIGSLARHTWCMSRNR